MFLGAGAFHRAARRGGAPFVAVCAAAVAAGGITIAAPAAATEDGPRLTHNVVITKGRFIPDDLGIDVGDRVRWVSADEEEYAIRSVHGPARFGTRGETLTRGQSYEFTFRRKGAYVYIDPLHYGVRGRVRVGPQETTAAPTRPNVVPGPIQPPGAIEPPIKPDAR